MFGKIKCHLKYTPKLLFFSSFSAIPTNPKGWSEKNNYLKNIELFFLEIPKSKSVDP